MAILTASVLPDGTIGPLLINGAPAPIAAASKFVIPSTPGCKPLIVPASTTLFFGASGNNKYNDNFAGRVLYFNFDPLA
jgi:hypothetical protein